MAMNGIHGSAHHIRAAQAAYSVAAVSRRGAARPSAPQPAGPPAASVRISKGGELLGKLQRLHDTNPGAFKRLMSELAEEAQARVEQGDGESAAGLTKLSARLADAARDGNLAPLVPALESGRVARVQYAEQQDAFVEPSDSMRQLFRGFVDKVNAALPLATDTAYLSRRR